MAGTQRTDDLLGLLADSGFEFIVVGGVAAVLHGSTMATLDLDVAAPFNEENMARLLCVIGPLHPRHAITPDKRPITESVQELATLRNLYVLTDLGRLDVLGELPPLGGWSAANANAEVMKLGDRTVRVLALADLLAIKEALARPKDLVVAQQLRFVLAERAARERGAG